MAATRPVPQLPEEMIYNILTLLPVFSLLECRFVCKLWASIISSRKFVEAHLTKSKEKQQSLPSDVLVDANTMEDRSLYLLDSQEDVRKIRLPSIFKGMNCCIAGSCDGLVTIAHYPFADVIYLSNPFTKLSKILPTPNIHLESVYKFGVSALGFGFDAILKDYKILRIALTKRSDNVPWALEVEVYSANGDSWKEIQVPHTIQRICFIPSNCIHAQPGVLYLEGGPFYLLSFDLHTEMFRVYPYPNFAQHEITNVMDFEGSVGMISNAFVDDRSVLSLWMLNDTCGMVSWTKMFKIELELNFNQVCLYTGIGQFVVQVFDGYILYDSIKKQTKKFPHSASFTQVNAVIKYTESLISLKGFEKYD